MSFNVKALGAFRKLGAAALIIAAILTLVMLFAGCKHKTESKKSEPKYTITFGVDGSNGTLKAKADGVTETVASPITVQKGKTVTFTATAAEGYEVDTWTVTPISALQSGTGTTGSATATITVSAATEVKVTFKKLAYSITFGVDGTNGTLKAEVDGNEINTGDKVKHGKTVTFTATPSPGYEVKEWKADGTVVTGNTSNTYTCTVTQAVHVTVSFAPADKTYTVGGVQFTIEKVNNSAYPKFPKI